MFHSFGPYRHLWGNKETTAPLPFAFWFLQTHGPCVSTPSTTSLRKSTGCEVASEHSSWHEWPVNLAGRERLGVYCLAPGGINPSAGAPPASATRCTDPAGWLLQQCRVCWATETSGFRHAGRRCGLAGLDKLPPDGHICEYLTPANLDALGTGSQRTRLETAALQHAASRRRSLICCFFLFARDLHGKLESGGF